MNASPRTDPSPRSGLLVALLAVLGAVAVAAVVLVVLGGVGRDSGEGDEAGGDDESAAIAPASPEDDEPGEDDMTDEAVRPDTDGDDSDQDRGQDPGADPSGTATSTTTVDGATVTTTGTATTGAGPTTERGSASTIAITDSTVEADDVTEEPTDDQDPDADSGGNRPAPPPPTDGACRIPAGGFDGQSGVVDLGTAGACGALSATIQAVNPRDDLAGTDWARDIRVCRRHPAAGEVGVAITTGAGSIDLTEGWNRSQDEAAADPVEAITVTFTDQETPETGPRPVALCRTDTAELSITHRPAG